MHTLVQLRRRPAPTPFRPVQARAAQPAVRSAVQPGGGPAARAGGRDAALLQLQRAAGVAALLAVQAARLEAVFQQAILTGYGITSTSPALLEGQAGESIIHWIFRL